MSGSIILTGPCGLVFETIKQRDWMVRSLALTPHDMSLLRESVPSVRTPAPIGSIDVRVDACLPLGHCTAECYVPINLDDFERALRGAP